VILPPQNRPNRQPLREPRLSPLPRCRRPISKTARLDILKIMPTPLSTAGAASGSDAWQELEDVLASLGQVARSPIEPELFYEHALGDCVRALSAEGGAAWLRAASGALRPVAHVNWRGADSAANAEARRAHESLLSSVAAAGHVVSLGPNSNQHPAAIDKPTDHALIVAPVQFAQPSSSASAAESTVAIFELVPRPNASPATYRGYEQFLAAVCELAAEYHAYRELARRRQDDSYRDELVRLSTQVHRVIDLAPTAYAVANEGRRVIGCDRLSVLATIGRRCRLLATSGASHVERRSGAARQMEQLAELVRPIGEPAWYADGQSDALPPIAAALEAHAEESHARHIAVLPLARPTAGELASASGHHPSRPEPPSFLLIAEQFDARTGNLTRERLAEVGELSATALYNALEVHELPFRWLLRPLAEAKRQVANHVTRSTAIAAAAFALVAALVLVPADFTVEAPGTLEPAVRQEVFAPRSGLVEEVLVANGADVSAGQPLARLRDPSLELDLKRVDGEMETVRRQLEAARATKSSRDVRDANPVELYRLSASEREFEQQLANLQSELTLLQRERASLVVRSPIAGRVVTWDVANRLTARPVERGEALVTVADLSADWQLELAVADDRIGYVLEAQDQADAPLPVRFRLRSADAANTGHVKTIGLTANVDAKAGTAARPTVDVVVAFDKSKLTEAARRDLRPGVSARAEIACGRRPLGYVWLHDLWDTTLTWLRF
jgi:multidrug efflux pump subunit AcrA (membrane-fusion protein)